MALSLPVGIDDFRDVRERGLDYVDKSHLIQELIDKEGIQVALLPRPRRFGKSLNLSMLRWFFEKRGEDLWPLFADLHIGRAGERYRAHFQRHPVIYLTLKGAKHERFEDTWETIRTKIRRLFGEHRAVLETGALSDAEAADYRAILDGTADASLYRRSLLDLCAYLQRAHGEKVVLLIDEYDEPIHAGFAHGYAPAILDFFRAFLTDGLKSNPHLWKAVLTGILRVARESVFSGLNNLGVYSILRREFRTCFGFTEEEVVRLLDKAGCPELLPAVRGYYNGYIFGGEAIYNPWSIVSFLSSEDRLLRPHWVSTSANELIRDLLQHHASAVQEDIEALLEGKTIERHLQENVALGELRDREDALWSLLVFAGYLKAEPGTGVPGEEPPYRLSIPNREVRQVYTDTFRYWMEDRLKAPGASLRRLMTALLAGDAPALEEQIQAFATNLLSYHDTPRRDPERVWQAFLIGLFAALEPDYQVRSNRESGAGRPDVMIAPRVPGKPGVLLELKAIAPSRAAPTRTLAAALDQVEAQGYAAELAAAGASPIHTFAVAFDGKRVWVRSGAAAARGAPATTRRRPPAAGRPTPAKKVSSAARAPAKGGGRRKGR
jgi:Predicted AAA-ATPase/PD-(D/E)XK nuclease superfamily